MDGTYGPLVVKIWGDLACFTRPENKVERVSYAVPTPSAARGMLESIFMKMIERRAAMRWHVEEIWVLKPIQTISITRNEVKRGASADGGLDITDTKGVRTQRQTLALRDVSYLIRAQIEVAPLEGLISDATPAQRLVKYRDQFRRRVRDGRCFTRPCLGCREFVAHFCEPDGTERPIQVTAELGRMLHSLDYAVNKAGQPTGAATPRYFDARLEQGVVRVPRMPVDARTASVGG